MSSPTPPSDPALARERDRLLTLANVQRMRGQLGEARDTLKTALAMGDPAAADAAPVHEMLGDILAADERWDEAKAAFAKAHELAPARASTERKFAQMTLRAADAAAEKAMAEAILRGEMPVAPQGHTPLGKRAPGMALLLSFVAPGFGQIYNGQLVKGLIFLGIYIVTLLGIAFSPDASLFFRQTIPLLFGRVPGDRGDLSPLLVFLLLVGGITWIYAVLDAPLVASKLGQDAAAPGGPKIDKSGWEV